MATKAPSAAAQPAQTTQTVKALVPVNYDHAMQGPGDTFEVRAEDLGQLLGAKAVELVANDMPELPAT